MPKIKVLLVAAELNPLAKVGGLADVIGALPKALLKLGVDVRLVIPKYGIVDEKKYPLKKVTENVIVPFNGVDEKVNIFETPLPGSEVPVYLIDHLKYLGRNGVYFETDASPGGSDQEAKRFTFLARSSLTILETLNWYPDIIHCHDWHVGMIPVLVKILAKKNGKLKNLKTLLTIHNLEYQGSYKTKTIFKALNISKKDYPTLSKQHKGQINSLQQAILTCDYLNTVSPAYAKEILTSEYGAGLETTLQQRADDLVGILNGIDVERFNPVTDKNIIANYASDDISGKKQCKNDLQKTCNLPIQENIPILGIVSRLADQKGIDLIYEITDDLAKKNMQFILLGTGDPKLEKMISQVAKKYPEKMYAKIEFDATFAQKIYAGSDLFLMPSRFEPCGLGQMIAMRYGTIPIVRATGGLKDTVMDYDEHTDTGDGFVFKHYNNQEFLGAIKRALKLYKNKEKWYKVIKSVMQKDFSWNTSAKKYKKLYSKLIK